MAPELVKASGVYAQKADPPQESVWKARKADQERTGVFQGRQTVGVAISPHLPS